MNIFQLEYFITLAETLSYTKASQKLHITQPTLSKLIISLEHGIGSQLFIRNKRDVQLTPAGKIFYEEIKKTLSSYDVAIKKVRDMENGTTGIVNLGFLGFAMSDHLPRIINQFNEKYPTIKINPLDYSYSKTIEALLSYDIDMAILPDLELDPLVHFTKKPIFTDGMCAVVYQGHKFYNMESIDLALLRDEPMINMNFKSSPRDHNLINNVCIQEHFLPNTVYEANSLLNMLVMVGCRVGITVMAGHMQHFSSDSIRFIPINGYEKSFRIVCVYKETSNESVPKLLQVIDEYFHSDETV